MHKVPLESCFDHAQSLRGSIVLITGGGSGFGSALAVECARNGAHVVIADINAKSIQATIKLCQDAGGMCVTPPTLTDVTSVQAQEAMFQFVIDNYARASDIVVANAGVSASDNMEDDFELVSPDGHSYPKVSKPLTFDINLQGAITTAELALRYWAETPAKAGHARRLVMIGSMSGFSGIALGSTYTMGKHCVTGYWKALSQKAKGNDFQCHLVAPYFSPTPILQKEILMLLSGLATVEPASVMKAMLLAASDPADSNGRAYLLLDHSAPVVLEASEYSPFDDKMIAGIDNYVMAENYPASRVDPTWGAIVKDMARLNNTTPVGLLAFLLAGTVALFGIHYGAISALNRLPAWAAGSAGLACAVLTRNKPATK